jgi:hypothetical protein
MEMSMGERYLGTDKAKQGQKIGKINECRAKSI